MNDNVGGFKCRMWIKVLGHPNGAQIKQVRATTAKTFKTCGSEVFRLKNDGEWRNQHGYPARAATQDEIDAHLEAEKKRRAEEEAAEAAQRKAKFEALPESQRLAIMVCGYIGAHGHEEMYGAPIEAMRQIAAYLDTLSRKDNTP